MNNLDFSKKKKPMLSVTLSDGSMIKLKTPSKGLLEVFTDVQDTLDPDNVNSESVNQIYNVCREILNNNLKNESYSLEDVENLFDIEDAITLLGGYAEFIKEVIGSKN